MEILNAFLDIQTAEQASKLLSTLSPHEIEILIAAFEKEPAKYDLAASLFLKSLPYTLIVKHYKVHPNFFRSKAKEQALKERLQEIVHEFSEQLHLLNQKIENLEKQFQNSPETRDLKTKLEIEQEIIEIKEGIHGLIELVWLTEFPELIDIFSSANETCTHLENYMRNYLKT